MDDLYNKIIKFINNNNYGYTHIYFQNIKQCGDFGEFLTDNGYFIKNGLDKSKKRIFLEYDSKYIETSNYKLNDCPKEIKYVVQSIYNDDIMNIINNL